MGTASNREYEVLTVHPGKASSGRSESHIQLSCWPKRFSGNLNITEANANIKGCSLKT